MQPWPGPSDPVPGERHEHIPDIHERALVREEDLADDRDVREDRDRDERNLGGVGGARYTLADDSGQPRPEERQRESGHDLVGAQVDGHHAVDHAEQAAGEHRRQDAEPRIACRHPDRESDHGPEEHHPLDAEIQNARPFGEDLADRSEEQDRAAGDAGCQDVREVHQAVASRRSKRTR